MLSRYVLSFILLLTPYLTLANTNDLNHNHSPVNFNLPINAATKPKVHLFVTTPKEFTSIQPLETFLSGKNQIIEFIPKNEKPKNWLQIFTVHLMIGSKLPVTIFTRTFEKQIMDNGHNIKILEKKIIEHAHYKEAKLAIAYSINNRRELLNIHYYSGPYDTVGTQYTTVIPTTLTDKQALTQSNIFMHKHNTVKLLQ